MPEEKQSLPEITCDRCVAPGTCCKSFPLSKNFPAGITPGEISAWLEEQKYPFAPLRRYNIWCGTGDSSGKGEGTWLEQWQFQCTKLGEDGRCTIYEDRPELCKLYTAGVDYMCVHMRMPDGNPIIPQLPKVEIDRDVLDLEWAQKIVDRPRLNLHD